MFFYIFSIDTVLSHEITFGNIRDEMVNKLFVTLTTRNKMRPKKARGRLTQSEVFFPLAYHAIVANRVVQQEAFVLFLSRIAYVLIMPSLSPNVRKSTLFVSIISISKEYSTTHYKRLSGPVNEWGQPGTAINGHRCDYDYDYINRSATLVLPRANSKMHWWKKISGFNRKPFTRQNSPDSKVFGLKVST